MNNLAPTISNKALEQAADLQYRVQELEYALRDTVVQLHSMRNQLDTPTPAPRIANIKLTFLLKQLNRVLTQGE